MRKTVSLAGSFYFGGKYRKNSWIRENGASILQPHFRQVTLSRYVDSIYLKEPEPLIDYILSCHGNQNQYLLNRYKDFRHFVQKAAKDGFTITKDAGIFLCRPS